MSSDVLELVRAMRLAEPGVGVKPIVARLQEQKVAGGAREVREALKALEMESAPAEAAEAPPDPEPAAPALSRRQLKAEDRRISAEAKVGRDHRGHKQRGPDEELAKLLCEAEELLVGAREPADYERAAAKYREAIRHDRGQPLAYFNLANCLLRAGRNVEALEQFLESMECASYGTEPWATAAAAAFNVLRHDDQRTMARPEWWHDAGLKRLSAQAVKAAPRAVVTVMMRAMVLVPKCEGDGWVEHEPTWSVGPRSAAEIREAARMYEKGCGLTDQQEVRSNFTTRAAFCRREAKRLEEEETQPTRFVRKK